MENRKLSDLNAEEKKIAVLALREYENCGIGTIDTFIKHHNLEPIQIEVGKVYKHKDGKHPKWICYYGGEEMNDCYGFLSDGQFSNTFHYIHDYILECCVEATEQEWFEALKKEAEKYKGTKIICMEGATGEVSFGILNGELFMYKNRLMSKSSFGDFTIMVNGIWAEIIDPKQEVKDKIQKLKDELNELEKLV